MVGRVGKVGKEGKEGRLREQQLPTLYQILQQSNKNCEKINEQLSWKFGKKFDLDTDLVCYAKIFLQIYTAIP